ncbi:MAG: hypothetical protein ABEK59_09280 [Halobacteria archaeon]
MGGKALTVSTRRIAKPEYLTLRRETAEKLEQAGYPEVRFIPHVFNKTTFGDLDLLLPKPKLPNLHAKLREMFQTQEIQPNKAVVSFEHRQFQVDLIHTAPENLETAQTYFAYNDLGMLMGVLAKRLGCKYGHDGLFYTYYSANREKRWDLFLSKNPRRIFRFLRLNYDRFRQGFGSLEEVFEFVCSSPLFDTDAFTDQEEWNHRRRTRNNKRASWHRFLQYIEGRLKVKSPKPDKPLALVDASFPEAEIPKQIEAIREQERYRLQVKAKFNGDKVRALTGLEGKELGQFIARFKQQFQDFPQFVLNNSQNVIDQQVILYKEQGEIL